MSLEYSTDIGYGIRLKKREADGPEPAGHVLEIHFYTKETALRFLHSLFRVIFRANEGNHESPLL